MTDREIKMLFLMALYDANRLHRGGAYPFFDIARNASFDDTRLARNILQQLREDGLVRSRAMGAENGPPTEITSKGIEFVERETEAKLRTQTVPRLEALMGNLSSILSDPKARYIDPAQFFDLFERYAVDRDSLRQAVGGLHDLPVRPRPKSSETTDYEGRGYIRRNQVQLLMDDVQYCLTFLRKTAPQNSGNSFNIIQDPSNPGTTSSAPSNESPTNPRDIFVVHGRNEAARKSLFSFLRSVDLNPLEWSEAIRRTGNGSPFIGEVLDVAFEQARAIIVLMTGDDEAQLREVFRGANESEYETNLTPQARPNVIFEAGMAFGRHADRTIIVQLGSTRPISDLSGRHTVRLNNTHETRNDLVNRLRTAGCAVNANGNDWLTEGDFDSAAS